MTLETRNRLKEPDLVELVKVDEDLRVEVNGRTILYLHANGRAMFYPIDNSETYVGRWKK